jgi:hypothetical protein
MTTELTRLTLPKPELLLSDVPASLGMYCPASSSAQLMRSTLMRAAKGLEIPFVTRVCHSTAAYPATRDVDMLVPESNIQLGSVEAPVCRIYGCVA